MNDSNSKLKRSITLPLLTFYGLGTILGAGIYVLIGEVVAMSGMFAPIAFLVAALMALFTAFAYAELSSRYPRSAGEALYIQKAFGIGGLSLLVGLLVVLIGTVSSATLLRGFAGYAQLLLDGSQPILIGGITLLLTLVAIWGIRQSVWMASVVTVVEIGGLILIIAVAGEGLHDLPQQLPQLLPNSSAVWPGIFLGAFVAFYAFLGFEDIVNVAEEVVRPQTTLPKAILLSLVLSTLLYMLVSLVAVMAVPVSELAGREAPLAWLYERTTGNTPLVITYISLFAIVNGALVQIVMGSRMLYGLARQRLLPAWLGYVAPLTHTPLWATLFMGSVILVFALWLPLLVLAQVTSFITLFVFGLVNLSLLVIKIRQPHVDGGVHYPLWIPLLGLLISIGFIVMQAEHFL